MALERTNSEEEEISFKQKEILRVFTDSSITLTQDKYDLLDVVAVSRILCDATYSYITELHLSDCNLDDETLGDVSEMLSVNKFLTALDLSDNQITKDGLYSLLIGLNKGAKTLKKLSLEDNNRIDKRGVGYICEIIECCTSLQELNLSGLPLHKNVKGLIRSVKSSASLKRLFIENTRLENSILEAFINGLCEKDNKCRLHEISLNYNQTRDFNVYTPLFKHVNFVMLRKLHISYFHGKEQFRGRKSPVQIIYKNMIGNKSIQELYLVGNNFKDTDCRILRSIMILKSNLKLLDLQDNNIEQFGAKALYAALCKNKKILKLRLDGNRFLDSVEGKKTYENIKAVLQERERQYVPGSLEYVDSKNARSKVKRTSFCGKKSRGSDDAMSDGSFIVTSAKKQATLHIKQPSDSEATIPAYKDNLINFGVPHEQQPAHLDNLEDEWESVCYTPSPGVEKTRNFVNALNDSSDKTKNSNIVNSGSNNLDDDTETCIVLEPVSGNDEDSSVIYNQTEDEEFESVIVDTEDMETPEPIRETLLKLRDPKTLIVEENEFTSRKSDKATNNWHFKNMTKSEVSFINHLKENSISKVPQFASIIDLSEESVNVLSDMLSKFENLLDREENMNSKFLKITKERSFVSKLGVIGQLKKQKSGKVIDYDLAKRVINQKLINRSLVRNVTLMSMFAKLRREIGSGVPTKIGGMLPSKLSKGLTGKEALPLTIERLESFATSLLLTKVVIWSIFKAFTVAKPSVDPEGRRLLEEFGKAMLEKNTKQSTKKNSGNRANLGQHIITGAVKELIEVLVLLKPVYAVSEALFVTVESNNPQPPLEAYEAAYRSEDKRAQKKLEKRQDKVVRLTNMTATLTRVKASKASKETVVKQAKPLKTLLDNVERFERHTNQRRMRKTKVSGASGKKTGRKVKITPEVRNYRKHCPERVYNILSDIASEAKCLNTILSIPGFLQTLISFCDLEEIIELQEKRSNETLSKLESWINALATDFNAEILNHISPALVSEVKKKCNLPTIELLTNLKRKQVSYSNFPEKLILTTQTESFFNTILNRLFSWKPMSLEGSNKIREVVKDNLCDNFREERKNFIHNLKFQCKSGCEETIALKTLRVKEKIFEMSI